MTEMHGAHPCLACLHERSVSSITTFFGARRVERERPCQNEVRGRDPWPHTTLFQHYFRKAGNVNLAVLFPAVCGFGVGEVATLNPRLVCGGAVVGHFSLAARGGSVITITETRQKVRCLTFGSTRRPLSYTVTSSLRLLSCHR